MEVKLKAGDSLNIPEGCKAVIKDNVVVFDREEKEEEEERGFKDGDILTSKMGTVLIFKEDNGCGQFTSHYNTANFPNSYWFSATFRLATEEEKQLLFDKMKEQRLLWNAEEKRVEKIRWRAEKGDRFYCFDTDFSVLDGLEEGSKLDDSSWRSYNYFRTVEQVEEAAKRVKEKLRKYHEELGE